jgi:hypothetical protein
LQVSMMMRMRLRKRAFEAKINKRY